MKSKGFLYKASALVVLLTLLMQGSRAQNWTLTGNADAVATSKLGTTGAIPLNLTTNNLTRLRIGSDGKVGIGTTNPQQLFHVEGPTLLNLFVSTTALSTTSGSGMIGYTKFLPTASGQRLGYFLFGSRGGAENNYHAAGMVGYAQGAWTAGSSYPAYLAFETTPSGSATRSERLRITASGSVGIGTTSPHASALLDLTSTTRGFLAPRMTQAQRTALASPAQGLLVFQSDGTAGFYYYDGGWKLLSSTTAALTSTALNASSDNAALQELKEENEKLRQELVSLKQIAAELKSGGLKEHGGFSAYLEQNAPNPFNNNTLIRYNLPENTRSASLIITDMAGTVVKTISLNSRSGRGEVTVNAGALAAGTYNYNLYVDNKPADGKRLVITR